MKTPSMWMAAGALALAATSVPAAEPRTGELWETKVSLLLLGMSFGAPQVQKSCVAARDAANTPQLPRFVNDGACTDVGVQRDGEGWSVDAVCKGARFSMTMREVEPGHREGEFRVEAPVLLDSHAGRITSRRIGSCELPVQGG